MRKRLLISVGRVKSPAIASFQAASVTRGVMSLGRGFDKSDAQVVHFILV